jgi:hypothetical protein
MTGLLLAASLAALPMKDEVATYANLAVYPIYGTASPAASDYISLDEGLKQGTVVVSETGGTVPPLVRNRPPSATRQTIQRPAQQVQQQVQGSGTVNTLWLTNKSGKKLFIMTGEIVAGGKQDRIIQKDVLIPPTKEPINLSVFCVEQQRWVANNGIVTFAPAAGGAGGLADPTLRGKSQNDRNQQAVWSQVESTSRRLKTENATKTYQANLNDPKLKQSVEGFVAAIEKAFPVQRASGAVVAINGKLVWMDRFMDNAMFRKYWPKMIRSYAIDAIQSRERTPTPKPPTYDAAMRFAAARDGKMTHEAEDGVWQLTKIDSAAHVIFELTDLIPSKDILVHASKMAK